MYKINNKTYHLFDDNKAGEEDIVRARVGLNFQIGWPGKDS